MFLLLLAIQLVSKANAIDEKQVSGGMKFLITQMHNANVADEHAR